MDSNRLLQRAEAFNHLFDAVVVTDAEGIIRDWNSGSEALYGYSYDEAIGQSVSILHVPEDVNHITSEVLAAVAKFGKWTGEVRMLHKDGSIGWIESACIPILDEKKQMIGALGVNRDITDRKLETEHLRQLAQYDQLTKIPNRNLLFDRISHLINQYDRSSSPFSLLYFDLDRFKQINDTYGHALGDSVLQEVVNRISLDIRKSDTIARIGGDEFVLLLENTYKESDIATVIESLSQTINNDMIIDGHTLNISCSIGSATFPADGKNSDQLLSFADRGMYQAKKSATEERYRKSMENL